MPIKIFSRFVAAWHMPLAKGKDANGERSGPRSINPLPFKILRTRTHPEASGASIPPRRASLGAVGDRTMQKVTVDDNAGMALDEATIRTLADHLGIQGVASGDALTALVIADFEQLNQTLREVAHPSLRFGVDKPEYSCSHIAPDQWQKTLGLTDKQNRILQDAATSTHLNIVKTGEKRITVHFLGSDSAFWTSDNRQNLATLLGDRGEHYKALRHLNDVWFALSEQGYSIQFSGHSKGGGLANASAQMLRVRASAEGHHLPRTTNFQLDPQLLNDQQRRLARFGDAVATKSAIAITLSYRGNGNGLMARQKRFLDTDPNLLQLELPLRDEDGNRLRVVNGEEVSQTLEPACEGPFGYHGKQDDPVLYFNAIERLVARLRASMSADATRASPSVKQ